MSTLKLGGTYYFDLLTSSVGGAATDADALPTAAVYEDNGAAAMGYSPTVAQRGALTGHYVVTVVATAGNGFEAGKSYNLKGSATVDGTAAHGPVAFFALVTSDTDALAADIAALNDLSASDVAGELATYDPPTKLELDTAESTITAAIAALNDPTAAATAAAVWGYVTRTLTRSAATLAGSIAGSTISIRRGDTFTTTITGLGSLAARSKLWLTIKRSATEADSAALVQIEETGGLLYLDGAAGTAAQGSITVDDEAAGDITVTIDAVATAQLPQCDATYDVQMLDGDGAVTTLTQAEAQLRGTEDVTRATS